MAELTGRNQATILYKISDRTGEPLDINGAPIAVSGNRQAVMIMEGTYNPDPENYEVEGFFKAGDLVKGTRTWEYDPDKCPPDTSPVWILTTGFWDNSAQWVNSETWNY